VSFRYGAGINKPGFNPLGAQTSTTYYNLYSWGNNNVGQLGLGVSGTSYSSPKQVGSSTDWSLIADTGDSAFSIKTNGTMWAWGSNDSGRLGLGNRTDYSSPKQIGALTTWSFVAFGNGAQSIAIKTDGTLWTWGYNGDGELGLNNRTSYSSPKQVGSLTTWATAGKTDGASAAIKTDGTLWTWGYNANGGLGLGNTTQYSSPKQVGSLTNWSKIIGVIESFIAVKTDGTLWAWGRNNTWGQLGLGNLTNYSSPKQIGALTNWSSISGAYINAGAIKTDGTLWTWGYNNFGTLGIGNITSYSSPKQVGALTTWSKLTVSQYQVGAIKTDGTLWAWGNNPYGQLGLGNRTYYSSPKQVGSLTTWLAVTSGYGHMIALG
jgi:alpha-tubulin suppressor-like RCC1 family protein